MDVIFGKNKKEQLEPVTAQVTGKIPTWLRGTLLRNGPGMHAVGESKYNHWFDGLALLHSFSIRDGEVYYRSKYLRSDTYNANIEANRIVVSEFGTMAYPDPCKNIFAKAFSYLSHTIPDFTDNCLINIMKCGKDFYATTETNYIRKINPHTLETLEKVDYRKYVAINLATAHPHYDGAGNVLNMGTSIVDKGKTKYVIFKIPASVPEEDQRRGKSPLKHTEVFCSIPSRSLLSPSYYHSFGLTDNHVVFLEQPFKLDILKMATAYMRGVSWASCMTFHKEDKTYIHIIDRRTRRPVPTKFYTDAMVVFHHVNAYEEDGCLLFDVIAYQDSSLYQLFYLANLNQDFEENSRLTSVPTLRRFALPLHVDKNAEVGSNLIRAASTRATATKEKDDCVYCQPELLYEGLELPQINYAHNGKPYRYIYAAGVQWSPIPTKSGARRAAGRRNPCLCPRQVPRTRMTELSYQPLFPPIPKSLLFFLSWMPKVLRNWLAPLLLWRCTWTSMACSSQIQTGTRGISPLPRHSRTRLQTAKRPPGPEEPAGLGPREKSIMGRDALHFAVILPAGAVMSPWREGLLAASLVSFGL
ncbi:beta,beta-carotene 15,15'-dioxygenase isoform X2 [Perognathus longimembris pacificus]|uniref:beta,beta-carotene 15,15'-dioxygenase isoform X1 n=1 Tax=Perognathus longimembris pacificus TaxID=214514 RepID=UPI002018B3F7|nr:beta,beta-carotene 15,15'-dioxygenase isoform X1 [Perognathus longimembris pacificus]XP_048211010.1 beta,beta-carotene 15,15'-dioxygenase isoform X2 [Perognathus longimembris pacificus]